jgi:eukaryotic-like serine/threonine-protein kinase
MKPDRWREVTRIYAAVVAREPGARPAALEAACGADTELRREVEELLAEEQHEAVVDRSAVEHPSVMNLIVTVGSQIGVFRIESLLGVGGMGEVYRARDTKLNRGVAIKILPPAFASDPDRLARFKREAQVLASLNHPHIAAIHGFEDSDDVHALVLELVEGPTLADRLARPEGRALPCGWIDKAARRRSRRLCMDTSGQEYRQMKSELPSGFVQGNGESGSGMSRARCSHH